MELAGLEPATFWVRYRQKERTYGIFDAARRLQVLVSGTRLAQFGSPDGRSA